MFCTCLKKTFFCVLLFSAVFSTADAAIFSDDFSNGATRDGWVEKNNGASAFTYDGVATIVPAAAQPSSLWHNFSDTVLQQGDTLTLSFDVMMSKSASTDLTEIRFGLGYSSSPLVDGSNLTTPVDGYMSSAPINGNNADPVNYWMEGPINWGNALTVGYARGALDDTDTYTINNSQMRTVQYRISRNGSVLTGETYVNGAWSAPVTYTDIIADFKFNAVGFMAPYSIGETFTYDNISVVKQEYSIDYPDLVVGTVVSPPVVSETSGVYDIQVQSSDFWNDRDNGVFTNRVSLTGDFHLESQVMSISCPPYPWAKAGIMVRSSLDAQDNSAGVYFTTERGAVFQNRKNEKALTTRVVEDSLGANGYVRIIRIGDAFYGAASEDGQKWISLGKFQWDLTPALVETGIGVAAINNATATAQVEAIQQKNIVTETGLYELTLVDNASSKNLRSFYQGDVVDLEYYASGITVRAATASSGVQSIVFNVDGLPVGTDSSAPFEFDLSSLANGEHTLEAIPYDGTNGSGTRFDSLCVDFDVNRGSGTTPPNIIYIHCDDLGYADCGFNGSQDLITPNLDKLAEFGVRCTSGYATAPQCGPSRAGMISGMYQRRFAYDDNSNSGHRGLPEPQIAKCGPELLKDLGYTNAMIGKWHIEQTAEKLKATIAANETNVLPWHRGFDYTYAMDGGSCHYFPYSVAGKEWLTSRDYEYRNLEILEGATAVNYLDLPTDTYQTTEYVDRALGFINRNKSAPFFLYLSFNAPHTPVGATEEEKAANSHIPASNRRTFAGAMTGVDREVGRIIDLLETENLLENTIIFFFSDNGGPTGVNTSLNTPFTGVKGNTLEGGIRVPFLVSWKGQIPGNRDFHDPVLSIDYITTLLKQQNQTIPDYLDGAAILEDLQGKTTILKDRSRFFMWRQSHNTCRKGDYKKLSSPEGNGHFDIVENIKEDSTFPPLDSTITNELDTLMNDMNAVANDPVIRDSWFAPAAPTSLAATDARVNLDWDDNTEPDFSSYNVYRGDTASGPYLSIAENLASSQYFDNTVATGNTYYYVVTAVDDTAIESVSSNETPVILYNGDLSQDGEVDMDDIAELSSQWQISYDMNTLLDIATDWLLHHGEHGE